MSSEIQTTVVDGKALAQEIRKEIAAEVEQVTSGGKRKPKLIVVLVGDDPASLSYIKGKQRACAKVGFDSAEIHLAADIAQEDLIAEVEKLNQDATVDGILVQLPLPDHLSANAVATSIDPIKDVDGLNPINAGALMTGDPGHRACTPLGIIEILDRYEIPIKGARAVVIGRSNIVGKPVAHLLLDRHATVTICHSRTVDLAGVAREADILIAAVGRAKIVEADWVKPGATVIDVGVNVIDGKLVGDVDFDAMQGIAKLVSPPRGGVGPMTITMLLRNTLEAYKMREGL